MRCDQDGSVGFGSGSVAPGFSPASLQPQGFARALIPEHDASHSAPNSLPSPANRSTDLWQLGPPRLLGVPQRISAGGPEAVASTSLTPLNVTHLRPLFPSEREQLPATLF